MTATVEEARAAPFDRWFEPTVWVMILANAGVTAWAFADEEHEWLIEPLHRGFGIFFTIEILIRLGQVNFNPRRFAGNRWNLFDLTLVLLSMLPALGVSVIGARLIRLARVARVFHSVRHLSTLRVARIIHLFKESR